MYFLAHFPSFLFHYNPIGFYNFNCNSKVYFLNISILQFEGKKSHLKTTDERESCWFDHIPKIKKKKDLSWCQQVSFNKEGIKIFLTFILPKKVDWVERKKKSI
jgi:hypothetical protein